MIPCTLGNGINSRLDISLFKPLWIKWTPYSISRMNQEVQGLIPPVSIEDHHCPDPLHALQNLYIDHSSWPFCLWIFLVVHSSSSLMTLPSLNFYQCSKFVLWFYQSLWYLDMPGGHLWTAVCRWGDGGGRDGGDWEACSLLCFCLPTGPSLMQQEGIHLDGSVTCKHSY